MSKYQVGAIVLGTVTGIKPYGAFIYIDEDYTGLVHISEVSDGFVRSIEDFMRVDEKIQLKILEIDVANKHMKLSFKSLADTKRSPRRYMYFSKGFRKDVAIYKKDFASIYAVVEKGIQQKEGEKVVQVKLDYFEGHKAAKWQEKVDAIHNHLHDLEKSKQESFGWVEQPLQIKKEEMQAIFDCAQEIRATHNTFVICGIGGSYLGARAGIEMLTSFKKDNKIEIIYFGHSLSSQYASYILEYLKGRDFVVNVISKSGTTLESAVGFRLLRTLLAQRYGEAQLKNRIFVTTDPQKGALRQYAIEKELTTFAIPSDIGGRYSVLTSVGLLPFAVAGIDIYEMLAGAKKAYSDLASPQIEKNAAYQYATARLLEYEKGKKIELLVTYEPQLVYLAEWWKQLYGESEGKAQKGLFPAAVNHTSDLHSLGQFIQEGSPILFETTLSLFPTNKEVIIHENKDDFDHLNELKNQTLTAMNQVVLQGTVEAHFQHAKIPNIILEINRYDAYGLGYLFYFFMKSCAMSSYLLGVNPFDQPGVEVYKKNVFRLLGRKEV